MEDAHRNFQGSTGGDYVGGNKVGGDYAKGDMYKNISNSTIVGIEREHGHDVSEAVKQVADFIAKSGNPSARALFTEFTQELEKPQHEKSTLRTLWDSIQRELPSIVTVAGAVAKIVTLF